MTSILTELARANPDVGVSELSRAIGLPKSAVHRLLTSLTAEGFAAVEPATHRYSLGPAALHLALAAFAGNNLRVRAAGYLQELRDRTTETTALTALVGRQRAYVDQREGIHAVRNVLRIGELQPLYLGSNGKAILAYLSRKVQSEVIAAAKRIQRADGHVVTRVALERDLAAVRRQNYATSVEERVIGAVSVAAPIFDESGRVIACLSISSVIGRMTTRDLREAGPVVAEFAKRISRDLGWQGTWASAALAAE